VSANTGVWRCASTGAPTGSFPGVSAQRTVPTPLSPTTRSFAAMHRGALREVRSVHPGLHRARAWPANPLPSSAIPASACTQPMLAFAEQVLRMLKLARR
jgi:hypothetical protein